VRIRTTESVSLAPNCHGIRVERAGDVVDDYVAANRVRVTDSLAVHPA
jgi:hypothetical protein